MYVFFSYGIDLATPMYGGKKGFLSEFLSSIEKGDTANTQKWEFPNHLGTHIDFPFHFHQNGQTADDFTADFWVIQGKSTQILDVDLKDNNLLISYEDVKNKNLNFNAKFIILKTGFGRYRSQEKYWKNNPGLSMDFSEWIINNFKKIKIIGLDSISISSWQHREVGREVHKKLLSPEKPILIIEDMNLSKVTSDSIIKKIYIAPLMVNKSDGSPCTILAEVKQL